MDRVPLEEAVDKEPQSPEYTEGPAPSHFGTFLDDPNYHDFSDFLGVDHSDRRDAKLAEKLSFLYNWGERASSSSDPTEVKSAIKMLKRFIGISGEGSHAIDKMYKWARLDSQRRKIGKEMRLLHE
jgi:hypothetical protein